MGVVHKEKSTQNHLQKSFMAISVLVRYKQAQTCLQTNLKCFRQGAMKFNWGEPERVPQLQYSIRPYDRRVPKRLRKEHGKSHTVSSPLDRRTTFAFPNVYAKNTESPTLWSLLLHVARCDHGEC